MSGLLHELDHLRLTSPVLSMGFGSIEARAGRGSLAIELLILRSLADLLDLWWFGARRLATREQSRL